MIETRWSMSSDADTLGRIHEDAWRFAYAGLIPGLTLERMIAARHDGWWRELHRRGGRTLVIELDDRLAGYAMIGHARGGPNRAAGEIYELYLDPVCHGAGLGKRLFDEARRRLEARALRGLIVWSLAVNEVGCRFYRALGGEAEARDRTRLGGVAFERIGFVWR